MRMNGNVRLVWILVLGTLVLATMGVQVMEAETAHVANHVVISEVQIATDEFVELYNPTNSDIDMTGWHWCYFSEGRNWNYSYRDRVFPSGATISAHDFYLIATTSGDFPIADWNLEYATHFLKDAAGSVGIFPWDPDTKTDEEAKAGRIDAVAWGSVTYVKESSEAEAPAAGKSIERKAINSSTSSSMAPSGEHYTWGNGEDTNNNSANFVLKTTSEPQNSSSDTEDCPAQSWFLHNDSVMYKENMSKPEDTVTVSDGGSTIWKANEPATVDVGFPEGTWTGMITLSEAFADGETFTVEVGSYEGSIFTSAGSKLINGDGSITYSLSIPASAFTVQETEYLALQISPSGAALKVKTGSGNSYIISPETDPGYPVPELSTLHLLSIGLLALAGYVLLTRRRK